MTHLNELLGVLEREAERQCVADEAHPSHAALGKRAIAVRAATIRDYEANPQVMAQRVWGHTCLPGAFN